MKQLKRITVKLFSYEIKIDIKKETQREKDAKKAYQKLKDGEALDTEDLILLQKEDML